MPPPRNSAVQFNPRLLLRAILAVAVGFVVFYVIRLGALYLGWGGIWEAASALMVPLAVTLLMAAMVLAGVVTGKLAAAQEGGHGLLLGSIILVVLVVWSFQSDALAPGWFNIVGAVVSLPMTYLGAELTRYKSQG